MPDVRAAALARGLAVEAMAMALMNHHFPGNDTGTNYWPDANIALDALASSPEVREALVDEVTRYLSNLPDRRLMELSVDIVLAALAGTSGTEAG